MDNVIKKYELSLWDDSPVDGEVRRCVIASDTMSSPAKAYNITLNRKSNGERVLTFSIVARYFDQETEDFVTNPYLSFLTNERKVKLRRQEKDGVKWYDFIIKDVAEDSSNQTYTYTAKDQHVQELAKSGFELEFDKEQKNNTDTKEELAKRILKGTDWKVEKGTELLEYTKEPVYRGRIVEDESIKFVPVLNPEQEPFTLQGKYAYVVYYYYIDGKQRTQILYSELDCADESNPQVNDEGVLSRKLYQILTPSNEHTDASEIFDNVTLCVGIQGERLVQSQKTFYNSKLEKYVGVYKDNSGKEVYGFTKTEYNTPELVENLITNGEGDFTSESGWYNTTTATRELGFDPPVSQWTSEEITSFIRVKEEEGANECWIVNTGLYDSRTKIPGFTAGQEYFFDCAFHENNGKLIDIKICEYSFEGARYVPRPNGKLLFSGLPSEKKLVCQQTVSSEELKKLKIGIFLKVSDGAEISKCQFYRYIKGVEPGSISTLETNDLIKTHYYYYNPDLSYTNFDDMEFLYEGYKDQSEAFAPVFEGYEKKRTITGKESNRYNLLQEVCEQFECWLRFDIEHDANGKVLSKGISLHEYAGDDNYAGFKYGINLKSIKRNIDSNQIVTKMITKDNSNEFAKNGFCSIARAPSNPSGTNVIYNFDYYVGQGLLSAEEVSNALYLTSRTQLPELPENADWSALGDIEFPKEWGLYSKLDYITSFTQSTTEEQIGISKNLTSLKASIDFEQARLEGAENSLVELEEDLQKLTGYAYEQFLTAITAEDKIEPPEGEKLTEEEKEHNRFVDWALSDEVRDYKVKIRHLRKEKQQAQEALEELLQVFYDDSYVVSYSDEQKKLTLSSYSGEGEIQKVWFFGNFATDQDLSLNVVCSDSFDWYITDSYRGPGTYDIDSFGSSDILVLPKNRSLIVVTQADEVWLRDKGLLFEQKSFQQAYDLNAKKLEYYNSQRKRVEEEFYQKYARFIQEGSWISEDYIDDELYYLDALATNYTSSRPKVSYTIDVFDLAQIEGYENYEFQIGDKTFVEDAEFFGYKLETIKDPQDSQKIYTIKVPIREEVVISEMTEGIDDITKNAIKVQNYKTQFDDLFQRIAATTESLQYNTGRYERSAKAVEPNGSISHQALQQAIDENGVAISNAGAQTVSIDEQGIITTDKAYPNKKVRVIGGGIYVTKDGGETWETGISGDGINANVITTGQLNTGEVNIMTGKAVSHRWDDKGITAYDTIYDFSTGEIKSVNNSNFVRFDEFGIYGIQGRADFNARQKDTVDDISADGIDKIERDSIFSLTKEGVTIGPRSNRLEARSDKLIIGGEDGLKATAGQMTIGGENGLKISPNQLTIGGSSGLKVSADELTIGGSNGLKATQDGLSIGKGFEVKDGVLTISGWKLGDGYFTNNDETMWISAIGKNGTVNDTTEDYVFYANGNFGVNKDGILRASEASVKGHIQAETGEIGKILIQNGGLVSKIDHSGLELYTKMKHGTLYINSTKIEILNWGTGTREVKYYKASKDAVVSFSAFDGKGTIVAVLPEMPDKSGFYNAIGAIYAKTGSKTISIPKDHYVLVSFETTEPVQELANGFSLASDGTVRAQGAIMNNLVLSGDIGVEGNATIAGWRIDANGLYATDTFYLAPGGKNGTSSNPVFQCGEKFKIKSDGSVYASSIDIDGGEITLLKSDGSSMGIKITSSGLLSGYGSVLDGSQITMTSEGVFGLQKVHIYNESIVGKFNEPDSQNPLSGIYVGNSNCTLQRYIEYIMAIGTPNGNNPWK